MNSLMSPLILSLLALPSFSVAYTWRFNSTPQQCGNLSITVSGPGGKPPYRVLILPSGPTPLKNNIEVRKIIDQAFPDNSQTVSFKLAYPANSQFVAVVSDASGFGSGGTSVAAQVTSSSDSSCFDPSQNVSPLFVFAIEPPNQIVQCQPTRLWWNNTAVQGTPNFLGIIPGGQSFAIPEGPITDVEAQGTGFSWTPSLRGGTTLIIVGGDSRGNGTAGSSLNTVNNGPNNIGGCLSDTSPSSTPGSPAGGSYPTGVNGGVGGGDVGGSGGGGNNTGAIVGGVVGGVVGLIVLGLLALFLRRRKRVRYDRKERPVDLDDDDDDDLHHGSAAGRLGSRRNDLPEHYQPEPFTVPDPTVASTYTYDDTGATSSDGRPLTPTSRSGTPDVLGAATATSSSGRKGPMRQMRPVNVIQHDDAGPGEGVNADDVETVELPPAYTNIKRQ